MFSLLLSIPFSLSTLVHASAPLGNDSGRVIHGQDVPEGKYPFIVSLRYSPYSPCEYLRHHFCGGSVINDNTILTGIP